ncbi:MAG: oligosaccharide flippase family protein [Clostridium saudiense]|nr:oligosaccharide flippase family protein [Clostridium saudiense]
MSKYKKLIKNILLFALSSFIPKAMSFFLVPIYTAYLTTGEYGVSDLINTTVSLFMPILTLNIRDAVLRFALEEKYNKKDCLNISLRITVFDIVFLTIFTIIELNFKILHLDLLYIVFFDIILVSNSLYDIFNSFCKGIDKVNTIVIASIVNSVSTFTLNIFLIVILKKGLFGFLLANSLGTILAVLIYIFHAKLYSYISVNYSKIQAREMIKYSFPMILSAIAWWINNASDRYIVSWMLGVSASGIYAVASKIPSILTTFQNIFMQAWSISAIKEFDKNDQDGFIGNMYTLVSCLLSVLCSMIILFNLFISKMMFSGEFYIAWKYVPPLVLSITVDGLALFLGNLFYAVKDTKSRALTTICGAIFNTLLNFILIKLIGVYGAAIATFVGYFSGFVISRILIKKYIHMQTNMKANDCVLLLLIIQVVMAYYGNRFCILQFTIFISIIFIYRSYIKKVLLTIKRKIKKV